MARFWWAALCVTVSLAIAAFLTLQTAKKRDRLALSTVKVLVGEGHGSGVHTGNRYIITAAHVVGSQKTVKVKTSQNTVVDADVLWTNEKHDIALLRAKELPGVDASRIACESPQIGQPIIAVGNPGPLEFITAFGTVSSGIRKGDRWSDYYIISMPVAGGMSGGPVIDQHGKVIGLVVGVAIMQVGFGGGPVAFGYVTPGAAICKLLARNA